MHNGSMKSTGIRQVSRDNSQELDFQIFERNTSRNCQKSRTRCHSSNYLAEVGDDAWSCVPLRCDDEKDLQHCTSPRRKCYTLCTKLESAVSDMKRDHPMRTTRVNLKAV